MQIFWVRYIRCIYSYKKNCDKIQPRLISALENISDNTSSKTFAYCCCLPSFVRVVSPDWDLTIAHRFFDCKPSIFLSSADGVASILPSSINVTRKVGSTMFKGEFSVFFLKAWLHSWGGAFKMGFWREIYISCTALLDGSQRFKKFLLRRFNSVQSVRVRGEAQL